MKPRALVVHARGTNRDRELADALDLAGADVDIVPLTVLRDSCRPWSDWQMLAIPGGFSHGDALGAGRIFALDLMTWFGDQLRNMTETGAPIIGVCNGFQTLVQAGILPGTGRPATLAPNVSQRFECRWVTLEPLPGNIWTEGLDSPLRCPVAHAEGRYVGEIGRPALRYLDGKDQPARGTYPANPNGSVADIAGVTDPTGTVLGLMPHPEDHVLARQDPDRGRRGRPRLCLDLFRNGVNHAKEL